MARPSWIRKLFARPVSRSIKAPPRCRPAVEALEDRTLLNAYTAATVADLINDINAANDKGQTALHGAAYFGGTTMVPFMVEHGARMNVVNKRGQTPWIITQGEYQAGSFIVHAETGEVLVKLGADTKLGKDIGREAALEAMKEK